MFMKKFLTTLAFIALGVAMSAGVFAQGKYDVKGVVVDQVGPVIGASVVEKGTTNGIMTGPDGDYFIKVASQNSTLEISCVGYKTVTLKASEVPQTIVLEEDASLLDEVVVIGYGTVKKSDMTGSVSAVKADQLNKGVVVTPADLLKGKAAGIVVTPGSGMPGAGSTIRIRGGSSLSATNDPLIVIDGLPVGNEGISGMSDPLASINPADIESFSVLKDASSTAIYGSRASNGVIVITTKKGSSTDKVPHVSADFTSSVSTVSKLIDVMNAEELKNMLNAAGKTEAYELFKDSKYDTNWQKEIYQVAPTFEGNASVTGKAGLGKAGYMPYRVSLGYLSQKGVLKTSSMDRATLSFNLTPTLLDKHLTVALNGKGTYANNSYANQGAIVAALQMIPFVPARTTSDINQFITSLNGYSTWTASNGANNTMACQNPLALLEQKKDLANTGRFIGNAQIDYKVHGLEDLSFNLNLGLDYAGSKGTVDVPQGAEQSLHSTQQSGSGYHTDYTYRRINTTLETYLQYSHDFEHNHHFDIMGGYSWQHFFNDGTSYSYKLTDKSVLSDTPSATEYYLVSFFGRANYSYDGRYMLTATIRRDGTSRFTKNHWGLFPSVAFAWNIKNESFLKNSNSVSDLKLRLSWGETGQQDLNAGNYPALPTYYTSQIGSYYMFVGETIIPVAPLGYNQDLKWETTTTYNAGLDYGFANGRIYGTLDVYYRQTRDLINFIPVPALSNLTNYLTTNIGNLENKGIEFNINAEAIHTKDWSWVIGANVAYNQSRITKLTASASDKTGVATGGIAGGTGNNIQMHQVGFPASAFYVYQQVYDQNGKPIEGEYVDRNGNGSIDADDRYFFHKPTPDFTFGLNTTLYYKNWTLSLSGHGSVGNWMYNNVASNMSMLADLWTNNWISNRVSSASETMFNQAQYLSDYYIQDASYFKFDNATLGYTFPRVCRAEKLNRDFSINVFGTVQNIATITKYSGVDPEIFSGIDYDMYPRPRTFILGVKFNF